MWTVTLEREEIRRKNQQGPICLLLKTLNFYQSTFSLLNTLRTITRTSSIRIPIVLGTRTSSIRIPIVLGLLVWLVNYLSKKTSLTSKPNVINI